MISLPHFTSTKIFLPFGIVANTSAIVGIFVPLYFSCFQEPTSSSLSSFRVDWRRPNFGLPSAWSNHRECKRYGCPWSAESHPRSRLRLASTPIQRRVRYSRVHHGKHHDALRSRAWTNLRCKGEGCCRLQIMQVSCLQRIYHDQFFGQRLQRDLPA